MTIIELKNELKTIAKELNILKPKLRNQQSKIDKENLDYLGNPDERDYFKKHWHLNSKIKSLKFHFRHKHIAYCLNKGRTYEQIESTVKENNEPNWGFIREIQNECST